MGRKPTISRETLLDLAEAIVREQGAKALTIEALARAANVSKGGIQYSFASKEELVSALLERWLAGFDLADPRIAALSGPALIRRYLQDIRASAAMMNAKIAGMMLTYFNDPKNQAEAQDWYQNMLSRLTGPQNRSARVAFLALDGLLMLQMSGQAEESETLALLDDIEASLS